MPRGGVLESVYRILEQLGEKLGEVICLHLGDDKIISLHEIQNHLFSLCGCKSNRNK